MRSSRDSARSSDAKAFYNNVLSFEGDISKNCQISSKSFKKVLLFELLEPASIPEGMPVPEVMPHKSGRIGGRGTKYGCQDQMV